jgi:hypothetical protein
MRIGFTTKASFHAVLLASTRALGVVLIGLFSSLNSIGAHAQMTAGTFADANNPSGPPGPANLDQIWKLDPLTGAVTIRIPISTTPAPGLGPTIPYILQYNSSSTAILSSGTIPPLDSYDPSNGHVMYQWLGPNYRAGGPPAGPWTASGPALNWTNFTFTPGANAPGGQQSCEINGPFIYTDEDGNAHDTNSATTNPPGLGYAPCGNYGTTISSTTADGSALLMNSSGIAYPNGTIFNGPSYVSSQTISTLTDTNGNQAQISVGSSQETVTDAMGRSVFTTTFLPGSQQFSQNVPGNSNVTTYSVTGSPNIWVIHTNTVSFGPFTMPEPTSSDIVSTSLPAMVAQTAEGSAIVITSIQLPNGQSYQFQYDPLYGTIKQISFPTGGYVRFVWGYRSAGTYISDDGAIITPNGASTLVATDAYLSAGDGKESHWNYTYTPLNMSTYSLKTTEIDPVGATTVYTGSPFEFSTLFHGGAPTFLETNRTISDSSGNLLRTIATAYNCVNHPSSTTTYNDVSPNISQSVNYSCDVYGNVTEKDESDFYTGSTPIWLRKTLTTYYWNAYQSYQTAHIVDRPYTVTVADGSGNPLAETQYDYDKSSPSPHGNLMSEKRCLAFSGPSCSAWRNPTTYIYYSNGEMKSKTDPRGYSTSFEWQNGYLTKVTNSLSQVKQYSYNSYTGQKQSFTDANNQTTTYSYLDPTSGAPDSLNRLRQITLPSTVSGSGYTRYFYTDTSGSVSINEQTLLNAAGLIKSETSYYDGLGRKSSESVDSDPDLPSYVDTTYDAVGNVYTVSNPYRSTIEFSYGLTTYTYDALNRLKGKANPDGSTSQTWNYKGNVATFTDEVFNQWQRTSDGLGRLTKVVEPGGLIQAQTVQAPTLETDYQYNALDNLAAVYQCGGACPTNKSSSNSVARAFSYDGVSQLIQSYNPEVGWTCFGTTSGAAPNGSNCTSGYDANGNLNYKTDARNIVTTYAFDHLNRLTSKSYSGDSGATPTACYQYDSSSVSNGIGRLASEWIQSASAGACPSSPPAKGLWSSRSIVNYDAFGHILGEQQCTPSSCGGTVQYSPAYTYDLAESVATWTNGITGTPSVGTLIFTNTLNGAGRLQSLSSNWSDSAHPQTLFAAQTAQVTLPCPNAIPNAYTAGGALANAMLGNGLYLNQSFDKRLSTACEVGTGNTVTNAIGGSATVSITGSEQSR